MKYLWYFRGQSSQKALPFAGQLVPHHLKRFDVGPLVGWSQNGLANLYRK